MHNFSELVEGSTMATLNSINQIHKMTSKELETKASTSLIKSLQVLNLQKTIYIIGVFSLSESTLQECLWCKNGFIQAEKKLEQSLNRKL